MKVLILGAAGQLGRELQETAAPSIDMHALDATQLDITDRAVVADCLQALRPALIINAAAYTGVDGAEMERDRALHVNARGVRHLAQAASRHGGRVVHVSTDYVFDGTKGMPYRRSDAPRPLNVYGESKLEGEHHLLEILGPSALVLRTAWLYSRHRTNFVLTMLRLMHERNEVRVVSDQISSPTWARSLAAVIWRAASRSELNGVYHWTDAGVASWYDFAVAIQEEARKLGLLTRTIPIIPIRSDEYPSAARRPAYSVLDKTDTWRDFDIVGEHWSLALRTMLKGLV